MAAGTAPNYTFTDALTAYNNDQVMTQTMWFIEPHNLPAQAETYLNKMQIYGQGFEVPNRSNEFADVSYRGYNIPTPTVLRMTQDHSMTINCDVHQMLRRGFLNWQACAIDPRIDKQFTSFAADRRPTAGVGASGLRLWLLAPNMITTEMLVQLYGVRVNEVGTIALSNTDGGVATFSVSFKSVYWQTSHVNLNNSNHQYEDTGAVFAPGADYQMAMVTGAPGDI